MLNFWNLIVESNTFNFFVLVVIIVMVWQKGDFSSKISDLRENIIDFIEKSKKILADAQKRLFNAENEVKNLDNEIAKELDEANSRARNVVASIEDMARVSVEKLEKNVTTVIENETRKVNNTLLNDTIDKAIAKSEEILRGKFRENPSLHDEYVNRSLEIFEKIEIKR